MFRGSLSLGLAPVARRQLWTPPSFDPDAVILFEAMTVEPDGTRKRLISDTIIHLKDIGVWPLKDILYVTAAHHAQASRLNWKDPAQFMLTPVNSPVFVADRHWQGDSSTSYLGSGFIPSSGTPKNWQVEDASIWVWARAEMQETVPAVGAGNSYVGAVTPRNASGAAEGLANRVGTPLSQAVTSSIGLTGLQRRGASDERLWKNGEQIAAGAAASVGRPVAEFRICGRSPVSFAGQQVAFASAGASLTDKEAAFFAAINTYTQAVGAA
ncbi:hypothetical protein [Chelatococcus sp.]|uniref:hypothetical protein n=1 Tax=Chelatococcus sp. TaxID=1953771 RepID=UPI001ECCE26B|nr:hypothetical protein [Chelatococcus sp.]MBX3545601.1 hypothetical protein [Chelatococcus sp.]